MENVIGNELLSLREAAAYLKRTERAIYNLVHKGKLAHFKHFGRLRFLKRDLDASLNASRVDALTDGGENA